MKISTKGRYGLRVMTELVPHFGHGPIQVEVIARSQEISGKYIHLIVGNLKSAGLVRAVRGPSGGCELTRNPSKITALDVVLALEGDLAPVDCVTNSSLCHRAGFCAARDLWCEVASAVDGVLSDVTLQQLAARQRAKEADPMADDAGSLEGGGERHLGTAFSEDVK